jgi:hypothetical protein
MRLRYHLAGLAVHHYSSYVYRLNDLQRRPTIATDFASFGQGTSLSESTTQILRDKFAQVSNPVEALTVVCQTAGESLGEVQVEATPIDQIVADVNW